MNILIVEDEDILSNVLRQQFIRSACRVEVVTSGDEVLAVTKKFKPDCILLDLVLPKKNGFDALKELKADASLRQIPVVILSNLGEDENAASACALGAVAYLAKTRYSIAEIVRQVEQCVVGTKKKKAG